MPPAPEGRWRGRFRFPAAGIQRTQWRTCLAWMAWMLSLTWGATSFLLRFADYSLAQTVFQFFFKFDRFQGGEGYPLSQV